MGGGSDGYNYKVLQRSRLIPTLLSDLESTGSGEVWVGGRAPPLTPNTTILFTSGCGVEPLSDCRGH